MYDTCVFADHSKHSKGAELLNNLETMKKFTWQGGSLYKLACYVKNFLINSDLSIVTDKRFNFR